MLGFWLERTQMILRKDEGKAPIVNRVRLIHWKDIEAGPRIERLAEAGYSVQFELSPVPDLIQQLRLDPPDAVVIDLSRLPSQGRDLGIALRSFKTTRHLPLVFVDGDPDKVARTRGILPDAVFCAWNEIAESLARAIAHPPHDPVVPGSRMAAYAGVPLATKLGIRSGSSVRLVAAPEGFSRRLAEHPPGVVLRDEAAEQPDLIVWFVQSGDELHAAIGNVADTLGRGSLWIAWPKKGSGLASDLGQQTVREAGLAVGLVDYKICSIDETWSALLFRLRKPKEPRLVGG